MEFTDNQIERYSRQIILPQVGAEGQARLLNARVLLIGAGGLGSPCAYYLAAAGVGHLTVVDADRVELNNLQRQIVHSTSTVGEYKVDSAKARLEDLNTDVTVTTVNERVTSANVQPLVEQHDIVVDGSDNFPTRYLMNDVCVLTSTPLVHGGIYRFDGQAFTILPHEGPCYRCLFPEPPPPDLVPSCQEGGILGVVAGMIGVVQANEVLKFLLGAGDLLVGRLLVFNALQTSFRTVNLRRSPDCPVCGDHPTVTELIDYEQFCRMTTAGGV